MEVAIFCKAHFKTNCNGKEIKQDWILLRKGKNVPYPTSKWHLSASKCPKFAVPWNGQFSAKPFFSKPSRAFIWHFHGILLNGLCVTYLWSWVDKLGIGKILTLSLSPHSSTSTSQTDSFMLCYDTIAFEFFSLTRNSKLDLMVKPTGFLPI